MTNVFPLWGTGRPRKVAGDLFHGAAIARLAPADSGATAEHLGELRPEPDNEHDRFAVAVFVGGERIAYIPREQTKQLQPRILPFVAAGLVVSVPVLVTRLASGPSIRVRVVMDERAALLVPVNAPPASPYRVLDGGTPIVVLGLDVAALDAFRRPGGGFSAYGVLRVERGRVVAVEVDGRHVGALDSQAGEYVRAIVERATEIVACRVEARWSRGTWTVAALGGAPVVDPVPAEAVEVLRALAPARVEVPSSERAQSAVPSSPVWIFNPPPGWPPSPPGWAPPPGWTPPSHLPPAPAGWEWWRPES